MPRDWTTDLQTIFRAYQRRDTLDIYKTDGEILRLSRGAVVRDGQVYKNYIRSVDEFRQSIDQAVDRVTVVCQNVNSELGFDVASDLRLLDYAAANYGRSYQSSRNPSLIADFPRMLPGVLANAAADEQKISFEVITDYESLAEIIAARNLSPKCSFTYKNNIECTSNSGVDGCDKTRLACARRGKVWENGGFEFFNEPTADAPGSGTNVGGIGGDNEPCFTLDTLIWTPSGEIPIGDFPVGKPQRRLPIISFDERTGEIFEDEIEEVLEHEAAGYYTFDFAHTRLNVTKEHPIYTAFNQFTLADDLRRNQTVKAFDKSWFDSRLVKIRWHSDTPVTVRNFHVKRHKTYFANRVGVHNVKGVYYPYQPYQPYQN